MNGFTFGNGTIEGRLTKNPEFRFHSCDRSLDCPGLQGKKVVYIIPIITRVGNVEVQEVGIGQGDCEFAMKYSMALRLMVAINSGVAQ